MRLFMVFLLVITFIYVFCEAKPTNEKVQQFPKNYAAALHRLYQSVSTDSCNNRLPENLRKDIAVILSMVLGYTALPVGGSVGTIQGLLRGIFLSKGDIWQILACGIYGGASGAEHTAERADYNQANAVLRAADIKTPPPSDYKDSDWLCYCPGDSQDQLQALVESLKTVLDAAVRPFGNPIGIVTGLANGALKGGGNIMKGLKNCPNDGNLITDSLNYGLKGFGEGTADEYVNTNSKFQNINF